MDESKLFEPDAAYGDSAVRATSEEKSRRFDVAKDFAPDAFDRFKNLHDTSSDKKTQDRVAREILYLDPSESQVLSDLPDEEPRESLHALNDDFITVEEKREYYKKLFDFDEETHPDAKATYFGAVERDRRLMFGDVTLDLQYARGSAMVYNAARLVALFDAEMQFTEKEWERMRHLAQVQITDTRALSFAVALEFLDRNTK